MKPRPQSPTPTGAGGAITFGENFTFNRCLDAEADVAAEFAQNLT